MPEKRNKRLEWSTVAIRQLAEAIDYIAEENLSAALEVRRRIDGTACSLLEHPMIGRIGRRRGTREIVVGRAPYIIIYRVRPAKIQIARVLHQRRKYFR